MGTSPLHHTKSHCYNWWYVVVLWLIICMLTVFIGCGKDTHSIWINHTQSRLMCKIMEKYFYFMLMVSFKNQIRSISKQFMVNTLGIVILLYYVILLKVTNKYYLLQNLQKMELTRKGSSQQYKTLKKVSWTNFHKISSLRKLKSAMKMN